MDNARQADVSISCVSRIPKSECPRLRRKQTQLKMGSYGFLASELINGARPAPVDKITYELAEQIEKAFEDYAELHSTDGTGAEEDASSQTDAAQHRDVSLEVEGRLGVVRDSDSGDRMRLPIITEAVLRPGSVPFHFSAGIRSSSFYDLFERVSQVLGCDNSGASAYTHGAAQLSPLQSQWTMLPEQNTYDSFYPVAELGKSVRVSYKSPAGPGSKPREMLWKQPLLNWSVFTGRDREDDEDTTGGSVFRGTAKTLSTEMVDYRIALNIERRVDKQYKNIVSQTPEMSRQRRRRSFVHTTGLRLDFTEVDRSQSSASTNASRNAFSVTGPLERNTQRTWEVEAELHPGVLRRLVGVKRGGDPRPLYAICAVFLGVLRNWCAFLNNKMDARIAEDQILQTYADLRVAAAPKEILDTYLRLVSRKTPLIGDYLFHAVAPRLGEVEAKKEEDMAEEDIATRREQGMREMEEATKTTSFSLYTHSTLKLVGPWECKKGPGNKPLVRVSRSMLRDISWQLHT